jgi:hypothetical protein
MKIHVDCETPEAESECRVRLNETPTNLQVQGRITGFAESGN